MINNGRHEARDAKTWNDRWCDDDDATKWRSNADDETNEDEDEDVTATTMISRMSPQGRFLSDDGVRKVPRRDCRVSTTLVTLECSGEVRSLLNTCVEPSFVYSAKKLFSSSTAMRLMSLTSVGVVDCSMTGWLVFRGVSIREEESGWFSLISLFRLVLMICSMDSWQARKHSCEKTQQWISKRFTRLRHRDLHLNDQTMRSSHNTVVD